MSKPFYTKKPMQLISVRVGRRDLELLRQAATKEEISQSEFLRLALRERGAQIVREAEPDRAA